MSQDENYLEIVWCLAQPGITGYIPHLWGLLSAGERVTSDPRAEDGRKEVWGSEHRDPDISI